MSFEQVSFRLRNDDGSESAATWKAALNTNVSLTLDENVRLRFLTKSLAGTGESLAPQLQYRHDSGSGFGAWTDVNAGSSAVRSSASSHITEDGATTEQLGGPGTFAAGRLDEVDGVTESIFIGPAQETEHEFCFQVRSAVVDVGDTIEFRITNGGAVYTTYTSTPSCLIVASVDLEQSSFRLRNDDGSETTATWIAGVDQNAQIDMDANFRVRFRSTRIDGGDPFATSALLYCRHDDGGGFTAWQRVDGSSDIVRASASPSFADNTNTTEQLPGASTFRAGKMDEVDGAAQLDLDAGEETEHEYCIQILSADVGHGDTIELRLRQSGPEDFDTYVETPSITALDPDVLSDGPRDPDTAVDDATVGTAIWQNPGNVTASDDSLAFVELAAGTTSHYLKVTDFDFALGSGAIIEGIVVEIEKSAGSGVLDSAIRIVKGGTILTTVNRTQGNWPGTDAYVTHGGVADLWGTTWTAANINNSGFGVAISCVNSGGSTQFAFVDHVRITVYYSPTPVSQTQGSPWEGLQSQTVALQVAHEARGDVVQTQQVQHESIVPLVQTAETAIESLVTASTETESEYECLATITGTRQTAHESRGFVSVFRESPYESIGSVAATQETPLESSGLVEATLVTSWESIGVVTQVQVSAHEAAGTLRPTQVTSWESAGPVAQTTETGYEALGGLFPTQVTSWESSVPLAVTSTSRWESLLSVSQTKADPWEATGVASASQVTAYEAPGILAPTQQTAHEATVSIVQTAAAAWAALGYLAQTAVVGWESLEPVAVSSEQVIAFESVAPISQTSASPWESLGPVAAQHQAPHEASGIVLGTLSAAWEAAGVLSATSTVAWTALGVVASTAAVGWESSTLVVDTTACGWESSKPVSRAIASGWESAAELAATSLAGWESQVSISQQIATGHEATAIVLSSATVVWAALGRLADQQATGHESVLPVTQTASAAWESRDAITIQAEDDVYSPLRIERPSDRLIAPGRDVR